MSHTREKINNLTKRYQFVKQKRSSLFPLEYPRHNAFFLIKVLMLPLARGAVYHLAIGTIVCEELCIIFHRANLNRLFFTNFRAGKISIFTQRIIGGKEEEDLELTDAHSFLNQQH